METGRLADKYELRMRMWRGEGRKGGQEKSGEAKGREENGGKEK